MSEFPFISVCCCTFDRPKMLGELIHSFMIQDYPKDRCELIILDDAGQYETRAFENIKLVSFPFRMTTLGHKRNACMALVSPQCEIICPADDDDIYFPHWLATIAGGIRLGNVWVTSRFYIEINGHKQDGFCLFANPNQHCSCGYLKSAVWSIGGYPALNCGEDAAMHGRLRLKFGESVCLVENPEDIYYLKRVYIPDKTYHASDVSTYDYYRYETEKKTVSFEIGWRMDYRKSFDDFMKTNPKKVTLH